MVPTVMRSCCLKVRRGSFSSLMSASFTEGFFFEFHFEVALVGVITDLIHVVLDQAESASAELFTIGDVDGLCGEAVTFVVYTNETGIVVTGDGKAYLSGFIEVVAMANGIDEGFFEAEACNRLFVLGEIAVIGECVDASVQDVIHGFECAGDFFFEVGGQHDRLDSWLNHWTRRRIAQGLLLRNVVSLVFIRLGRFRFPVQRVLQPRGSGGFRGW